MLHNNTYAGIFSAGITFCLILFCLNGCAGQDTDPAAQEETQYISDDEYYQEFDESILKLQQPFTRTELTRIMNDGNVAIAETRGSESPEAAFDFLVEQRKWDEDRLNYILIKISYIVAQLKGKTFTPGEARFYKALSPTPQEVGMVNTRLEPLRELLPHFPR